MRRYLRLVAMLLRLSVVGLLEFRADFWIELATHFVFQAANLLFFGAVWGQVGGFGGLTPGEMQFFVSTFIISDSLVGTFVFFGILDLPNAIKTGDMDLVLAKPVSSQFYATFRLPDVVCALSIAPGAALIAYAIGSGGVQVTPSAWLGWTALLVAGTAISYSCGVIVMSLSFVALSVNAVWALYSEVNDVQRYPIGIYRQPWRAVFTVTLPMVLVANVPAHLALNKVGPAELVWFVGVSGALVFASTRVWKWGLRRYQSASS